MARKSTFKEELLVFVLWASDISRSVLPAILAS